MGDFVQATPAFSAIRQRFSHAHITLLTTPPFQEFGQKLGIFDAVIIDKRLKLSNIMGAFSFLKNLKKQNFDCIIDLQNVDRTRLYGCFFSKIWHGPKGYEATQHPQQRFANFLKKFDIKTLPPLSLKNLAEPFLGEISKPYVLVVPGASYAHGGAKCLPQENYGQLCEQLRERGIQPVIIGGNGADFSKLYNLCPKAQNLVGKTSFYNIISLAQNALFAIGNDTGPMLLAASGGCATITFYSDINPPALGGAQGENHFAIHVANLKSLTPNETLRHLEKIPLWSRNAHHLKYL